MSGNLEDGASEDRALEDYGRQTTVISPDSPVRVAPVSGLQRGLWFLDRWNPQAVTYSIPWVFELAGPLDLQLLEEALNAVVARHEALRTTFDLRSEGLSQLVHDQVTIPFATTDLRDQPDGERSEQVEQILAAEAVAPFDLATGPLIRAHAIRRSDLETTVFIAVHHIVWDGWSADVFEREWAECYSALVQQRSPNLPVLTAQYADYAIEEQETSYEEHLAYWKSNLENVPGLLELPTDRPRPATQSHRGHTEPFDLLPGTAARIRALAETEGVTPFMVQLAAFALLVNRYTGAEDMVIGTPVTTRNRPELENLVGYFVNLLPLRIRLGAAMTFRDLLEHVQEVFFDGFCYLDLPFDQVVDQLGLVRSEQHSPLVQVVFGAHAEDREPLRFGPASASRQVRTNGTTKFDLIWSTFDDGELRGEAEYRTDLFDPSTIHRLAADYQALLTAALDDCDRPIHRLEIPSDISVPVSAARIPEGQCLHRLF